MPAKTRQFAIGLLGVSSLVISSLAMTGCDKAGTATNDNQKKREQIMKDWGNANKTMGGMVKDPATFKAEDFKAAAAKLNQDPWTLFTADSKGGRSKDEIWSKADDYKAEIDKYKSAVVALNTAAATATNVDGVKSQFASVGESCKSCHDKFRKPE